MFCRPYRDEPVTSSGDVRVSNAEREEVIERLHGHAADGRLTLEEFEERVNEVYAAKTGAELRATLRELPGPGVGVGVGPYRGPWRVPRIGFVPVPLIVLAVVVAIVVLTPAPFALIPITVWSMVAIAFVRRRRRFGPPGWPRRPVSI
jgi:Domain of unknown function (DUF1707)